MIEFLLIMITQNTGRCGKSTFLIVLIQWLIERGVTVRAIDSDNDHRSLSRAFPGANVVTLGDDAVGDVANYVFERLEDAPVTLADPRAHQKSAFQSALAECDLANTAPNTAVTILLFPQDDPEVIKDVENTFLTHRDSPNVRFVSVLVPSIARTFNRYDGSELQKLLLARGSKELKMPFIHNYVQEQLALLELELGRSISVGEAATTPGLVSLRTKASLTFWLNVMYKQFDDAYELLVPEVLHEMIRAQLPRKSAATPAGQTPTPGSLLNRSPRR